MKTIQYCTLLTFMLFSTICLAQIPSENTKLDQNRAAANPNMNVATNNTTFEDNPNVAFNSIEHSSMRSYIPEENGDTWTDWEDVTFECTISGNSVSLEFNGSQYDYTILDTSKGSDNEDVYLLRGSGDYFILTNFNGWVQWYEPHIGTFLEFTGY